MEKEQESKYLKTLVKGAGIAFIGMVFAKLLAYGYRIIIARYFGPADYGLFSLGLAVFTIFSVIALLGFNNAIIHYIAYFLSKKDDKRIKGVITFSFRFVIPFSVLLGVLLYLLSDFISVMFFHTAELGLILKLFSIALPFYSIMLVAGYVFVGFQEIRYRVYTDSILSNVLKVGFLMVFVLIGFGISGIVSSWILGNVGGAILAIYFLYKVFPGMKDVKSTERKREMIFYSMPLFFSNIVLIVLSYTDILLLGYFPNIVIESVGVYSASVSAAQLLNIIPMTLTTLFIPILTKLYEKKKISSFKNMYRTVTKWAFLVNFPLLLMMLFFSDQIIVIFFGGDFASGNTSLVLLSLGYLFFSLSLIPFQLLNSIKKTKPIFYVTLFVLILSVAMSFIFIPMYGIEGAALSLMIANIIRFVMLIGISYQHTKILPFSGNMVKMIISGGISLTIVNIISGILFTEFPLHVMIFIFQVFISIYLVLILVMRGFDKDDAEMYAEIEKKMGIRVGFLRRIINRFI